MRVEWVETIFSICEEEEDFQSPVSEYNVYQRIHGCLGVTGAVKPYGGLKRRAGETLERAKPWTRFYDLVLRLFRDFQKANRGPVYVAETNQILAAHGVVWQLTNNGKLERKLPSVVQSQVEGTLSRLSADKFAAARELFELAKDAFDARPRRDRDAGTNAFDGLESVIKTVYSAPTKTFGQVLDRHKGELTKELVALLKNLEVVRHNHLGHGMTNPYTLSTEETDFVYVSCVMGAAIFLGRGK